MEAILGVLKGGPQDGGSPPSATEA
jgi:hypothetical protein